jgi:hypothetical protein
MEVKTPTLSHKTRQGRDTRPIQRCASVGLLTSDFLRNRRDLSRPILVSAEA